MSKAKTQFILLGDNGTYYRGMVAIGPCFGGSKKTAKRFDSRIELAREMMRHWACSGTVEEVPVIERKAKASKAKGAKSK